MVIWRGKEWWGRRPSFRVGWHVKRAGAFSNLILFIWNKSVKFFLKIIKLYSNFWLYCARFIFIIDRVKNVLICLSGFSLCTVIHFDHLSRSLENIRTIVIMYELLFQNGDILFQNVCFWIVFLLYKCLFNLLLF